MRKLVTAAAIAAFSGGATMAVAADLGGMPEPVLAPPPVLTNWSGFYLGVGIGGLAAFNNVRTSDACSATNNTPVTANQPCGLSAIAGVTTTDMLTRDFELGSQGVFGTVQAGYDYQFPISRWVAGVFVDFDWSRASNEQNSFGLVDGAVINPVTGLPFQPAGLVHVNFDNEWSVGGRLGYLFTPETLVYGLAAFTQGQASVDGFFGLHHTPSLVATPFPLPFVPFSETATSNGFSAGLGVETHLRDNWYLKLEYRFSQFGGNNLVNFNSGLIDWTNGGVPVGACPVGSTCFNDFRKADIDTDVQTARVVLTYKFNRPIYEPLK